MNPMKEISKLRFGFARAQVGRVTPCAPLSCQNAAGSGVPAPPTPGAPCFGLIFPLVVMGALLLSSANAADKKLIIIAGKPSHAPLIHEFRAGSLLLQKCLSGVKGLSVEVHTNSWVADDKVLETADAVFIYSDGGPAHPVVFDNHFDLLEKQIKRGMGFGCAHYALEIPPGQGGEKVKPWFAGEFEHQFSVDPVWEPKFKDRPRHPIANGVKPFSVRDEWYFNRRFSDEDLAITPVVTSRPPDARQATKPAASPDGSVQGERGRDELMLWTVDRPDGGRGFGITVGHSHLNWGNDDQRKLVLNALLWITKLDVPANGVSSKVTPEDLTLNLDDKPDPRIRQNSAKTEEPKAKKRKAK